jgi:hypothetical protein
MTAAEAKREAVWNSIPNSIRSKIERAIEWGQLITYFYKSSTPDVFKDIDTTIVKLQLLGYTTEYGKVDIAEDNEAVGISTDTKLTIRW